LVKDVALQKRKQARFSTFAKFAWLDGTDITRDLKQHASIQCHELACKPMAEKEARLGTNSHARARTIVISSPQAIKAQQTFKGRVPKPLDWLDCFVETTNLVSWRKQAKLCLGKSGATSTPESGTPLAPPTMEETETPQPGSGTASGQPQKRKAVAAPQEITTNNLRKKRRRQTRIMAECVRNRHKKVLRKAQFCSLAVDEAQGRKLVHFRCDYNAPPWHYQGTMGVYKVAATTMEEGEQDHALKSLTRLDEFLTRFCTPLRKKVLGTQCDQELKDHLLQIIVTVSSDGGAAERRALYIASEPGLWQLLFHLDTNSTYYHELPLSTHI